MIVTAGGRFGGYGFYLSKGVAGIRHGKPVFLYNLLDLEADRAGRDPSSSRASTRWCSTSSSTAAASARAAPAR